MPLETPGLEPAARERVYHELYEITLRAGYILRITTASLPLQHLGHTWYAAPGLRRGAINASIDLQIDDTTITVPNRDLQLGSITRSIAHWAKVRAFHGALVVHRAFDYKQAASAITSVWRVQGVRAASLTAVEFGLESLVADLDRQIPRVVFQLQCNNTLGDSICAVDLVQFQATSTVVSATMRYLDVGALTPSTPPVAAAYADGYFDLGHVTFLDGNLVGLEEDIMAHVGTRMHFFSDLPEVPNVGSAIRLLPGCHGTITDCRDKFGNLRNPLRTDWRRHILAFPYTPDMEAILF